MKKVYYSPVENASKPWKIGGLILRTLVSFTGILGLSSLICSAAGVMTGGWWGAATVTTWHLVLYALIVSVALGAASLGRIPAVVTPIAFAGIYAAVVGISYGNPVSVTVKGALRIYNMALYGMTARGYSSLGRFMVQDGYDYTRASEASSDPYRFVGAFLIAVILGIFLYFTSQKKVRVVPLAMGITAILAPILTYNIAKGTSGVGFTVCFVCAALGMKFYDVRYSGKIEEKEEKKKKRKEKKAEKKALREKKKEAKLLIRDKAESVYIAAAESEMGLKKARAARRAVIKAHKDAEKKALKDRKAELKKEKKNNKKSPDGIKEKEKIRHKREVSYMGGYAGAGTALVVMLALWIPMATVSGNFRTIDAINNKVQIVRTYVTAYLKGNDIDLNQLYAYGVDDLAPRKLTFEPLEYRDKKLFRVEAPSDNSVYLRSWVGTNFDYKTEEWTSDDTDTVLGYRQTFGEKFTPDEITNSFYKYVYPSSTAFDGEEKVYKNFLKYGMAVEKTDVWRISGKSLLLFVPTHMNTDVGLTAYRSMEEPEYKYSRYYEGVYSSRFYKYGHGYGTVSYITAFNRADSSDGLDNSAEYYKLSKEYIRKTEGMKLTPDVTDPILYDFEEEVKEKGLEYLGVSLPERYFTSMTDDERAEVLRSFETEEAYSTFAYNKYTAKADSEIISEIAESIKTEALKTDDDGTLTVNESARAVAQYLRENCKFTLTPNDEKYYGDITVLEAFLTDVKEGYSTHFATAAAAILREYGIPVRYCEGMVASEFTEKTGSEATFRSELYDRNASSWIEVYIDGMGWVQYEVCEGELSDKMYNPKSATISEDENKPEKKDDDDKFADDKHESIMEIIKRLGNGGEEATETDVQWLIKRLIPFGVVLLIALIVFFLCREIYRRAQKALGERYSVIEKVQNKANAEKDNYPELTKRIDELIMQVFTVAGAAPEDGELPDSFADRIEKEFGDLSNIDIHEVMGIMKKAEFGHGISFEEADLCAEYLKDISTGVYGRLKFTQKIKLRYVKRML